MIKTVSFAPPRAVSGAAKSSAQVAARNAGVQKARAQNANARSQRNAPVQPALVPATPDAAAPVAAAPIAAAPVAATSLGSLFPKPSAPAEVSAARAREQLQGAPVSKSRSRSTASVSASPSPRRAAPSELSLDLFSSDSAPVAEATQPKAKPQAAPKTKAQPRPEAAAVEAPVVQVTAPQAVAPQAVAPQAVAPQAVAPQAVAPIAPAKRAKRAKVPVNLAEQYGQSLSKRVESGVELPIAEEETPKKRLNRAERAARRELMNPDDDLRARLQRAQNAVPLAKPERRPRGWRFNCGRCGRTSYFETPGALCSCGALAIKE